LIGPQVKVDGYYYKLNFVKHMGGFKKIPRHSCISSSGIPFSSCPQSLPASESFPMSQLLARGGQSTGVSASALYPPKKSQG